MVFFVENFVLKNVFFVWFSWFQKDLQDFYFPPAKIVTPINKQNERRFFFVDCSITLLEGVIGNRIGGTTSPLSYAL